MNRYRTQNGNEYTVTIRNGFNRIHFIDRSNGGYKSVFVGSVSRGVFGDPQIEPCPNRHAHQQIVQRIEQHAGSPIV